MNDIVVLKLGSSVLRSGADLPRVVSEIYRHVRSGEHVVELVRCPPRRTRRAGGVLSMQNSWVALTLSETVSPRHRREGFRCKPQSDI